MGQKITSFDRATCRVVAQRIEEALKSIADELGVRIQCKGGSYTSSSYTCKVEVATISADGTVKTRESDAFVQLAPIYGLKATDLGRVFRMNGRDFQITGLATRRSKRPVIASDTTSGKSFVFAIEDVKRLLPTESK